MAYFATAYTIHFDDTMAYGSHHFLTAFKFQCAARESFLFGEKVFDVAGVRESLDKIHLLTSDAYSRNLHPTILGDRVAILLTLEEWGKVSARFCYRVVDALGNRICAGFQTLICADASTGNPIPLPLPVQNAMNAMREIEEVDTDESFRGRVLAGGSKLDSLFRNSDIKSAVDFLSDRYPSPGIIAPADDNKLPLARFKESGTSSEPPYAAEPYTTEPSSTEPKTTAKRPLEAWVFSGQGAFDAGLLSERVAICCEREPGLRSELESCADLASEMVGGDARGLMSGSKEGCQSAIKAAPDLTQVAIHLQNVLGARIRQKDGYSPAALLGHSFGEIASMTVGGCLDLLESIRVVCSRIQVISDFAPPNGGLLAVSADRQSVETEAKLLGLSLIAIAGRNHDEQTVASGPKDQLEQLKDFYKRKNVAAISVASPTAYHNPSLQSAASHWIEQLRSIHFKPPTCAIYTPIGRRFLTPEEDTALVLASQLVRPFDMQGGLCDLVNAGVKQFVDCGSAGLLERLIVAAVPSEANVIRVASKSIATASRLTEDAKVLRTYEDEKARGKLAAEVASPPFDSTLTEPNSATSTKQVLIPKVAIVGEGCILPGGANSPEQLFAAIQEQREGIVDQRNFDPYWSEDFYSEELVPDRSTSHLSGRVQDESIVAPPGIDAETFQGFTRTQRLLCVALAPSIDAIGKSDRVLCLMGATADGFEDQDQVSSLSYAGIDPRAPEVDSRMNTARSAFAQPHDAIQEVFDRLIRPGLQVTLVDAACASSLYAVALGMRALETDQADVVIAGGVFCPGQGNSCLFSQFMGTTSTGCRPYDAGADGVVFSEGAALVALRRAEDAERLGIPMHAIVRGVGLSSDGRSPSANVPQTNGQLLSLQRCYANYGIDPGSITAIEGHGTSTPVGDSTELDTLRRFFSDYAKAPIPLHSLKGLLGHAGWAAGTASMIAASQYLRTGTFPAQAGFKQPSPTLQKSEQVLSVSSQPVSLPPGERRIAIDGFGFGGANAHLVLESCGPGCSEPTVVASNTARDVTTENPHELVIVAEVREEATLNTPHGMRFDREKTVLPKGRIVLPELADDMDISQTLAVILAHRIVEKLPTLTEEQLQETSLILGLRGKTERGVEATLRIMTDRFCRNLKGQTHHEASLREAHDRARPSGAYTLQCMMPNVAAGRAALLLNLNGPNFVVDAGKDTLRAACSAAEMLLSPGGSTQFVVVANMHANSLQNFAEARKTAATQASPIQAPVGQDTANQDADYQGAADEFAFAFGVTTREIARRQGWDVLGPIDRIVNSQAPENKNGIIETASTRSNEILLERTSNESSLEIECPIHEPIWVEKEIPSKRALKPAGKRMLVLCPARDELVPSLLKSLPHYSEQFELACVGASSNLLPATGNHPRAFSVDMSSAFSIAKAQDRIARSNFDAVVTFDSIVTWELSPSLEQVANDNSLCEFLFLVAQRKVEQIKNGDLELWGLFSDGWRGEPHPSSGAVAGLLKSLQREYPGTRCSTICTMDLSPSETLQCLAQERLFPSLELEVVYAREKRLVRRLQEVALNSASEPPVTLTPDSFVVATGGARGVTAVMLEAIARDYGCTIVALGRSPLEAGPGEEGGDESADSVEKEFFRQFVAENPGVSAVEMKRQFELSRSRWEAARNVRRLGELGGVVEYFVADVADEEQVASTIERIANRFGRVDLILHGAGVQKSKKLANRSLNEFRRTYSVKVDGLRNLVESCNRQFQQTPPVHVLTSAYSVFGNDGQHDYGAANETLDRLCCLAGQSYPNHWTSIPWLAWEGIGMTRGSEYRTLAKQRNLSGVTPEVGQALFRQVLAGKTDAVVNIPLSPAEHIKYGLKTVPVSKLKTSFNRSKRIVERSFSLSDFDCLQFHSVRNVPTLPGAWILELFVRTAMQLCCRTTPASYVTVNNLSFNRFVRPVGGREPNLRVIAEETPDGVLVWLLTDILHSSGAILAKDIVCATAELTFEHTQMSLVSSLESMSPIAAGSAGETRDDPYCSSRNEHVNLSGPFDCLDSIRVGAKSRQARFQPDEHCNWKGHIPALLLDAAWRVGAMHATSDPDALFVPVQMERLILPVGLEANSTVARHWEIRSSDPFPAEGGMRWSRTEVIDLDGMPQLIVENALATRIE